MNKSLLPTGWEGNNLPQEQSEYVHFQIIEGSFNDGQEIFRGTILRTLFHPEAWNGWELKDCLHHYIPDEYLRYRVVKDWKRVVRYGIEGYILRI